MKKLTRLALALVAVAASAVAVAEPFDSADQARRERNREELMARHGDVATTTYRSDDDRPTLREKSHRAADSTRSFTHRQAQKMRNFGERQNRRYGTTEPAKRANPYEHGPQ
ncbi:MAG: hypothetical protein ACXWIG_02165 [Caldimonas sp.]